jgi:hypothetical protein
MLDTNFIMMGGIFVALICAAISYVIADRNGMSKVLWTILGFIFGIFGLLATFLVAFSKNKDSKTA